MARLRTGSGSDQPRKNAKDTQEAGGELRVPRVAHNPAWIAHSPLQW
jgi:hypothetical protein